MDNDRDINSLKNELNAFDKQKEECFELVRQNKKYIDELQNKVKNLKKERNSLTDSVKTLKQHRDEFNKQLKEKIDAFKKVIPKKKEKPKVHINVGFLKKEIKAMEYKIETEGLSFDKEQKLMKVIKERKKQIDENSYGGLSENARNLSKEIDEIRKKADESHRTMRAKADESQKKHEEVIKSSNELRNLENKQKEYEFKIRECKRKIDEINQKLGAKLEQAVENKVRQKEQQKKQKEHHQERRYKKGKKDYSYKQHKHVNIEEMQKKTEEKLKKGQKITTDDLLAFQNK